MHIFIFLFYQLLWMNNNTNNTYMMIIMIIAIKQRGIIQVRSTIVKY